MNILSGRRESLGGWLAVGFCFAICDLLGGIIS